MPGRVQTAALGPPLEGGGVAGSIRSRAAVAARGVAEADGGSSKGGWAGGSAVALVHVGVGNAGHVGGDVWLREMAYGLGRGAPTIVLESLVTHRRMLGRICGWC